MNEETQGGRKAPRTRQSRKGVELKPWKGGRTARIETRITPAAKAAIIEHCQSNGLSLADWVEAQINALPGQQAS